MGIAQTNSNSNFTLTIQSDRDAFLCGLQPLVRMSHQEPDAWPFIIWPRSGNGLSALDDAIVRYATCWYIAERLTLGAEKPAERS